jgi:hypothetical protein
MTFRRVVTAKDAEGKSVFLSDEDIEPVELDDGASVDLNTNDFVVQIGARHRWTNRGKDQAVIFSAIIGAQHA